jgi:hypothetical protein
MTFDDVLEQVVALLKRQGRVSYRAMKRRFDIDDEYVDDLKAEIIQAQRLGLDEDGAILVWTGDTGFASSPPTSPQPITAPAADPEPLSYTPQCRSLSRTCVYL